jgi:hypothetical protein
MSARTPFCGHCKNIGKQYNTHFTRKTPNQTSELVCPELLKKVCTDCKGRNHTFDKCPRPVSKVASNVASAPNSASTVAVPAYKAALQTPKSKVASSVASSVASTVAAPAYNYEDSYQYYSNYEEFSRSESLNNSKAKAKAKANANANVSANANANASANANANAIASVKEPVAQQTLTEYGEQLYVLIAKNYPYRAGKITGMFLELDVEEIVELIQNPASLEESVNKANELLDRKYPWGHIDEIFKPIRMNTRSSANNSDNIEVQPLNVREEYRLRVYAAHPEWHSFTINKIVEYFMKKQLSPEEIYEQFLDFEAFKVEVDLTFAELNK